MRNLCIVLIALYIAIIAIMSMMVLQATTVHAAQAPKYAVLKVTVDEVPQAILTIAPDATMVKTNCQTSVVALPSFVESQYERLDATQLVQGYYDTVPACQVDIFLPLVAN